jgi:heat shock protein HtpX
MAEAYGLYSHIRINKIRSWLLLAGLFVLAYGASFGVMLIAVGSTGGYVSARDMVQMFTGAFPFITTAVALWIFIGFRINVWLIGRVTGAQGLTRDENRLYYALMENLCISRGIPVPKLMIVEDDALNAFASGVNDKQYTVTVTRGLLNSLSEAEVEAVLAHELTHIRNGDVRLMIIAVVIAGVISFAGEMMFRGLRLGAVRSSNENGKGGIVLVLIGLGILFVSWVLAAVVRFSLSRSREYLADAGAVELTKNPDAMISALLKIAGRADMDRVPSSVMDMCFENDPDDFGDLFATHPSIAKRVQALVQSAGGRVPAEPPRLRERADLISVVENRLLSGGIHADTMPPPRQIP